MEAQRSQTSILVSLRDTWTFMLEDQGEWNKKHNELPKHQNTQRRILATVVQVICINSAQYMERHVGAMGKWTTSKWFAELQ